MPKRIVLFLLLFCLAFPACLGEAVQVDSPDEMPEVNADGFLESGSPGYYYMDHASGIWLYTDADTRLEITRHQTKSPALTYYTAEIHCRRGTNLFTASWNQEKPGRSNALPQDIAVRDRVVYAQSGDFYSYRVKNDRYPGIIIRDGKTLYKKTYSKYVHAVPNLATLALFAAGRAEVHESFEVSAKEFQSQGAENVLAFGPILIRDGEIQDLSHKDYSHQEPRSCLGIVDDGHYIGLLVEGRKNHSEGATLEECAEILWNLGCNDAINLDGGNTSAMLFMGQSVQLSNSGGVDVNDRSIPDILCAGRY